MATFGDLNAGATGVGAPPANSKAVSKFTLDRAGTVDVDSVAGSGSSHIKAVIYDNSGSGGLPGARKGISQEVLSPSGQVNYTFSPGVALAAGDYWLGFIGDTGGLANCVALTNGIAYNANTYASGPTDPFGASPSQASFRYPISAGYTPTLTAGTYLGELRGGESAANYTLNTLYVIRVTPSTSVSASKLTLFLANTYAAAKIKGVIYDATGSGGTPGSLLGTTNELTGLAINGNDLPFPSAVSLTGGSTYYIGLLSDTTLGAYVRSQASSGYSAARTYSSGAPGSFPASPTATSLLGALWATVAASSTSYPITVTTTQAQSVSLASVKAPAAYSTTQSQMLALARASVLRRTVSQPQAVAVIARRTAVYVRAVVQTQAVSIGLSQVSSRTVSLAQPTTVALRRGISLTRAVSQAQLTGLVGGASRLVSVTQATQVALARRLSLSLALAATQAQAVSLALGRGYQRIVAVTQATAVARVRRIGKVRSVVVSTRLRKPGSATQPIVSATARTQLRLSRQVRLTRALGQPQSTSATLVRISVMRTVATTQRQSMALLRNVTLRRSLAQPQVALLPRGLDLVHTLAQPTTLLVGRMVSLLRAVTVGSSVSLDSLDVTVRYQLVVSLTQSQQVAVSTAEAGTSAKFFIVSTREATFAVSHRSSNFAVAGRGVRFTVEER